MFFELDALRLDLDLKGDVLFERSFKMVGRELVESFLEKMNLELESKVLAFHLINQLGSYSATELKTDTHLRRTFSCSRSVMVGPLSIVLPVFDSFVFEVRLLADSSKAVR